MKAIELKMFFNSIANVAISQNVNETGITNDPATGLVIPRLGDDFNQREGRVIILKKLTIKGVVAFLGAEDVDDTPCGQIVYLAVVLDKQPNGATITSSDVITNPSASIYLNTRPFKNPNGLMRFKILAEKLIVKPYVVMAQTATNEYSWPSHSVPFEFVIDFKAGLEIRFNNVDGGSIADVVTNAFHFLAVTGGDTIGAVTSRMDASLSYNSMAEFYG